MERENSLKYPSDLIVKYLTNGLTAEEQLAFEQWLNESAANRALVESFRDTKTVQKDINALHAFDANTAWANLSKEIQPKSAKLFPFGKWVKYGAAAVVLCCAIGLWYSQQSVVVPVKNVVAANIPAGTKRASFQMASGEVIDLNTTAKDFKSAALTAKDGTLYFIKTAHTTGNNVLRTPNAGEYKLVLPDGTKVWLNASSSLSFANNFNANDRKVYLKGEAYFEVAHQKNKPFTVSFNHTEVEVLGTHFNINTYAATSKTTLLEGAVKITENGKQQLLKPGEEATVSNEGIDVAKVETFKAVAWKEGDFLFEEENMTNILEQVARWYDVKIAYDGQLSTKKYSGNIRRQADLSQVLDMLTTVSGNQFTLSNRTVTVKFK